MLLSSHNTHSYNINSEISQSIPNFNFESGENKIYNWISFLQPPGLRDHEKQHEAAGHVLSEDEKVRLRQKFEKARGRPSIQEMNYESVHREEEKRKQKISFGEDTRKTKRSSSPFRDAVEDEAGEGGDSSSIKVGLVRRVVNGLPSTNACTPRIVMTDERLQIDLHLQSHKIHQLDTFQIQRKDDSDLEEAPKRSSRLKPKTVII